MNESNKVIAKNTSALMGAQSLTWIFSFFATIMLPRYIGPNGAGQFALAYAIWTILGNVISFGSGTLLTKDIARTPEKAGYMMGTVLVMRGIMFLISCIGLAIYMFFMHYPMQTIFIIVILGLAQPFGQAMGVVSAGLSGIERMEYISLSDIISKAINVGLIFVVITFDLGIYVAIAFAVVVVICSFFIQVVGMRKYITIQLNFDPKQVRYIFYSSMPFIVSGLILTAYFQMDKIIMSNFVNAQVMGWYSVSINLFGTFLFLPSIVSMAFFPAYVRTHQSTNGESAQLLSKSIDLMFLFGIPIGFGINSISDSIIQILYGPAFAPGAAILAMMGFVIIFTYLTIVISQYMVATDKIHLWTILMVAALVITVPLDIWLIPLCERIWGNGGIGGAITFLITEFGMAAVGVLMLPRGMLGWSNVRIALSTFVAGLCMLAACWWVREQFLIIPIIVGGLTYTALILLLRVVPREDMRILLEAGRGIIQRIRSRQLKSTTPSEV